MPDNVLYLSRTHPLVEGLVAHTMDTGLDPLLEGVASRSGVIRTPDVDRRTVLLFLRFRFYIVSQQRRQEIPLLAKACKLAAFSGRPGDLQWLSTNAAEALLEAQPEQNVLPQQAAAQVESALADQHDEQAYVILFSTNCRLIF